MYIRLQKEVKDDLKGRIQTYYYEQTGDEIGDLAAENWLDFIIKELGPHFYNQAVTDSKDVLMDKMLQLEEDLYALKRPISR
ncbi:uncharacterized protein (DUF2164 family) [Bacillus pakistanensis]|uniref:Uncharacterized protein (DUF2164 family) n=1 Tax=Rossellomorea pakistanensis TaxID=992288 RepID=A0ABS2N8L2_9BACI|nr:DUF2164 domain-containing protein [Bacillus pakistanensis]MBM7584154.1 uncharacterized protein (DUF2164 family) [Bacillus pakistanensis]